MLLDVMETCESAALSNFLPIFKRMILLIQIITPIILIVMSIIQFITLIKEPDDKKGIKKVINKVIAAVIVFIIPVIINAVMGVLGESTEFSKCWLNADETTTIINHDNYIPIDDSDDSKGKNIIKDKDYEPSGTSNKDNNGGSNTSVTISKVVFIGDSRTGQMYAYKTSDWSGAYYSTGGAHEVGSDVFIGEGSQGLNWLKSTGIPAAEKYMSSGTAIVILMGVNDTYNVDGYISYLKSNVSNWTSKGAKVYYASVGPCDGSSKSLNTNIENFNSKLKNNLPSGIKWIDVYSYLESNGYTTTDGIHYNSDTYTKVYNYIKSAV